VSFERLRNGCDQTELVDAYALGALPQSDAAALATHISTCAECSRQLSTLGPVVDALAAWPTDILRPSPTLWSRLASRIGAETGREGDSPLSQSRGASWRAPEWKTVAPGISCKLLATDSERDRVSMLVRLAPGTAYPPHVHAGVEELHLLDGELWIEERKLHPGDYNRAEAGSRDRRVWSETGCTCVLITSSQDALC
jgi:anti-sigma factor ChrR (cupin superfamily)